MFAPQISTDPQWRKQYSELWAVSRSVLALKQLSTTIDPHVVRELERRGISVYAKFASTPISVRMIEQFSLILCMESRHRSRVLALVPTAFAKTFTLVEFANIMRQFGLREDSKSLHQQRHRIEDTDVPDPIGEDKKDFEICAQMLHKLITTFAP